MARLSFGRAEIRADSGCISTGKPDIIEIE
jgi:hypothetical protein